MKLRLFFSLYLCLVALSNAAPIPFPGKDGEGKSTTPAPQPSRAHIPTPVEDPNVPLPGRNGVHHNPATGITTAYYGDDHLPEHMGHLQRNQELHPGNHRPMPLASSAEHTHNRNEALHNIPSGGTYRNTGWGAVRDEKHIAMLSNEHHSTATTVERLPAHESSIEGGLTSRLKSEMEAHGSKGQLHANPGWLALSPHQRIAHEAPARLNSQTFRHAEPGSPAKKKLKPDPAVLEAEAKKKAEGYTPVVDSSGMALRHRQGVLPPPPPVKKDAKPPHGVSNLVPGRVGPPGHLWHPDTHGASHAGVPVPVTDAHTNSRHPPRPQDHDHYMRQQHEAHSAAQAAIQRPHPPAPHPHPGPESHNAAHHTEHFRNNLVAFNAAHPPHAPAHGAHHAEAPARLQHPPAPHHDNHAPAPHHNAPSTSHQATLPHHPAPPHQGSSGSGKGKGK